jgi:hypothetical protein
MDFYRFVVTNFKIDATRAIHNDTLHLTHTVHVDGDMVALNALALGDFNNGSYDTQSYVHGTDTLGITNLVINNPLAKVSFLFQLLNAGNISSNAVLTGRVTATADQLAGIGSGLFAAGAAGAQGISGLGLAGAGALGVALEVFANIYAWLSTDCDGPVAVDHLSGPRFVIDAWADADPTGTITRNIHYPGTDSPEGCGGNSDYTVGWLVQHWRGWAGVRATQSDGTPNPLQSRAAVAAATHRGAIHAFGVMPAGSVIRARTFTGQSWDVDPVGSFALSALPLSAVNFADRLYVLGVKADHSVSALAFTLDGGSWATPERDPLPIETLQPVAVTEFGNRLNIIARDSGTGSLVRTSTADLLLWDPWVPLPASALAPASPVATTSLGGRIYVFGISDTKKPPESSVVVCNSSQDGITWSGWQVVEGGVRPERSLPTDQPLDVAAAQFGDRIYIASRWQPEGGANAYVAVNFSSDGINWSGWRQPESTEPFHAAFGLGIAGLDHHLYVFASDADDSSPTPAVSVH